MCAKHSENPTMLSRVTAKNVGDVFFESHCRYCWPSWGIYWKHFCLMTCNSVFVAHVTLGSVSRRCLQVWLTCRWDQVGLG